jgi:hypothetical protein
MEIVASLTPQCSLQRSLDGPHCRSGSFEEELSSSYRKLNNSNVLFIYVLCFIWVRNWISPSGEKTRMCVLVKEVLWAIFRPMSYEITV